MSMPSSPSTEPANYHAYLLRIWREEGEEWRVSLQSTRTGERVGFADLHTAVQFVEQHLHLHLNHPEEQQGTPK